MTERERLAIETARRLIRTRLRQHLFRKMQKIEVDRGEGDVYRVAIDIELSVEAASEAAWRSTLKLWDVPFLRGTPQRARVEVLIRHALAAAIERSRYFIQKMSAESEYHGDEVNSWVLEFIKGFDPSSLVDEPCVSGT